MYELTDTGKKAVQAYTKAAEEKQKKVLAEDPETSIRDTFIPNEDDVYNDLQMYEGDIEPGVYEWTWSVSDEGDAMDYPLHLEYGRDYVQL